jgi:aryl-alcohol dehydrogenase-like predicted oxidoreductase
VERKQLGKTGLMVSPIGFGGAPLGLQGYLGREDRSSTAYEDEAVRALRTALERGINFFDTAPGYGDGRSEEIMGKALAGRRDEIVLATKYHQWHGDPADEAEGTLTQSLARLRTDHVDLLQLHGGFFPDDVADRLLASPALQWAAREKERGRTRFLGITAETTSGGLERLLQSGRFDTLQISYNFVSQEHCDYKWGPKGIIPMAKELGMGVLTMRTATSGFLQRALKQEFPQLSGPAITAFAIRFVLSTPEVDCALVGMKTVDEVLANVALVEDESNRLDIPSFHDRYGFDLRDLT